MATAELLCCDIRGGVKSGTVTSQPEGELSTCQDTCCGSTSRKDLAQTAGALGGEMANTGAP